MTVSKGTLSRRTSEEVRRAQSALDRRHDAGGLTFRAVGSALSWYYEARERLQSPQGAHPRGETTANGETVFVRVDGGRRGDIHEVHTTLSTIARLLGDLAKAHPAEHGALELRHRDGRSLADIGGRVGMSQSTASALLGRAEFFMAGGLRWAGILR